MLVLIVHFLFSCTFLTILLYVCFVSLWICFLFCLCYKGMKYLFFVFFFRSGRFVVYIKIFIMLMLWFFYCLCVVFVVVVVCQTYHCHIVNFWYTSNKNVDADDCRSIYSWAQLQWGVVGWGKWRKNWNVCFYC